MTHRSRVVSLVPSSTETLLALGADVIACTRFCEQPDIAHVGGTKNPEIDAIIELSPDLVVLDREENRLEDHDELVAAGVGVFVTEVNSVETALDAVTDLAAAAGLVPPPSLNRPGDGFVVSGALTRRALVPIWRRPWMAIGPSTYGASLLRHLGIDVVPASDGPYPEVDLNTLVSSDIDVVLVPSEPYAFSDAHLDELGAAVPTAVVLRVDGQDLFWWGSRTPSALERLRSVLAEVVA